MKEKEEREGKEGRKGKRERKGKEGKKEGKEDRYSMPIRRGIVKQRSIHERGSFIDMWQ